MQSITLSHPSVKKNKKSSFDNFEQAELELKGQGDFSSIISDEDLKKVPSVKAAETALSTANDSITTLTTKISDDTRTLGEANTQIGLRNLWRDNIWKTVLPVLYGSSNGGTRISYGSNYEYKDKWAEPDKTWKGKEIAKAESLRSQFESEIGTYNAQKNLLSGDKNVAGSIANTKEALKNAQESIQGLTKNYNDAKKAARDASMTPAERGKEKADDASIQIMLDEAAASLRNKRLVLFSVIGAALIGASVLGVFLLKKQS